MLIIKITLTALFSIILLFILTRIIGNRQMSQLTMFEYITGITIGSIAAEFSTSDWDEFQKPLIAMIVYTAITILISVFTNHSDVLRRALTGKSMVLLENGKLRRDVFSKSRIDLNEFLMIARDQGYFDLSDVQLAILEPNGRISFMPKASRRPATPADLSLNVPTASAQSPVIVDGKILYKNLKAMGLDEYWLKKQLELQGTPAAEKVFLALLDDNHSLSVYLSNDKTENGSRFD